MSLEVACLYCRFWHSLLAQWILKPTWKQSESWYHLQSAIWKHSGSWDAAVISNSCGMPRQERYYSFSENVNFGLLCECSESTCSVRKFSEWEQSILLVIRMTIWWWYEITDVLLIHLHPWQGNFFLGKVWIVAADNFKTFSSNHCVLTKLFLNKIHH